MDYVFRPLASISQAAEKKIERTWQAGYEEGYAAAKEEFSEVHAKQVQEAIDRIAKEKG